MRTLLADDPPNHIVRDKNFHFCLTQKGGTETPRRHLVGEVHAFQLHLNQFLALDDLLRGPSDGHGPYCTPGLVFGNIHVGLGKVLELADGLAAFANDLAHGIIRDINLHCRGKGQSHQMCRVCLGALATDVQGVFRGTCNRCAGCV